jgi:hypothetical protein
VMGLGIRINPGGRGTLDSDVLLYLEVACKARTHGADFVVSGTANNFTFAKERVGL